MKKWKGMRKKITWREGFTLGKGGFGGTRPRLAIPPIPFPPPPPYASSQSRDFIFRNSVSFFGGVFDTTLKNVESEEEPNTESKEEFLQLSCFIQQEVKYMHTGLRSKVSRLLIC